MITAVLISPKNFPMISMQTEGLMTRAYLQGLADKARIPLEPSIEDLHESLPPGSHFVVRNYIDADGVPYSTWTTITQEWLEENFEFDEEKILTQYTKLVRKVSTPE